MELTGVLRSRIKPRVYVAALAMAVALIASLMVADAPRSSGLHNNPAPGVQFSAAAGTYIPSADTFRIRVTAIGADGGSTDVPGGQGGVANGTIPVTAQDRISGFTVFIATGPGAAGNATIPPPLGSDGAPGGGASGLRRGAQTLIVGAGGGGAGGEGLLDLVANGDGGSGPATPVAGGTCAAGADGAGGPVPIVLNGGGGGGGNCTNGGTPGAGVQPGTAGSSLQGGTGGDSAIASGAGGGGGSGLFGGGGGGAGLVAGGGGGGGGGASFVVGDATDVSFGVNGAQGPAVLIEELLGTTQCSDGVDNADPEDNLADIEDPGCHTDADPDDGDNSYNPNDNDETNPQCFDDLDNDGDGLFDEDDPGCHTDGDPDDGDDTYNRADNNETDSGTPGTEGPPGDGTCTDGVDNDGDGLIDDDDPGCVGTEGPPGDDNCTDGIDNDGDGLTDGDDPDCQDDGEGPPGSASCTDGIDNDGDGLTDSADPDCQPGGGGAGALSDLVLNLHTNKAKVKSGKLIGATVRVRNLGPAAASNVEVITTLDKGKLQFKGVTGNGCTAPAPGSNIVVCKVNIPVGQSVDFTIEAKTKGRGKAKIESEAVMTTGLDRAPNDNKDREKIIIKARSKKRR